MTKAICLFAIVFGAMLIENRRSRRNEDALRASGAIEPRDDVYRIMQIAYPASFAAMILEGWLRPAESVAASISGAVVFVAGKALKYWAIAALGHFWSFRVLVVRGARLVTGGPYRWLRHPNYVGVAAEIGGVALLAGAPVTGTIAFVLFSAVLLARIRVEERALDLSHR
ncbi:MAG: isoprenylcysteine carboxyl methyltransferase family protein [Vicinamibacterales bacterium]